MRPLAAFLLAAAGIVFPAGSRLHEEADVKSLSVALIDEETELEPLDFRDGWLLVRYLGVSGWVREGKPYSLHQERGDGLLTGPRRDEELVGRWRARLVPPVRELRLGGVTVVTDADVAALESELVGRAAFARARLAERLGFRPPSGDDLVLFLFSGTGDASPDGERACGRSRERIARTAPSLESRDETVDRVLHQVGHLLAFDSIGSDLPPWLEEGLASAFVEAARSAAPMGPMLAPMDRFWAGSPRCPPSDSGLGALFTAGPDLFLDVPAAACLRRDAADLVRFLSDAPLSHRPWRFRRWLYDVVGRDATCDVPSLLEYVDEDRSSLGRKFRAAQERHRGPAGAAAGAAR